MNKSSFCQIVVLGSAMYVPFMVLTPHQRREIIEDLLDIKVFSTMNSLLKQKSSVNRDSIQEAKYAIDLIKDRIDMQNELIARMAQDHTTKVEKIEEKIAISTNNIERVGIEHIQLKERINVLLNSIVDKENNKKTIRELALVKDKLNDKVLSVEKQIKFFHDNDTCLTCTQPISQEFKDSAISTRKSNLEQITSALPDVQVKYDELMERCVEIETAAKEIQQLQVEIASKAAAVEAEWRILNSLEVDLIRTKAEVGEHVDRSKLRDLVADQTSAEEILQENLRQNIILSAASVLLKDGGIKSKIIKQYIPIMNKLINKYLAQMDFFVQFELDENFNETIKSRFRDDFGYQNFSEGEKLRIDLSILFAWRAIAKMRNSASTNLLIMDEVLDGALDASGMDEFLTIIQEMNKDSNVFVISHRGDQLADKFHSIVKFEKQGNFSRIV
jgi:hypothetical protein